jgi:hypothetical protein
MEESDRPTTAQEHNPQTPKPKMRRRNKVLLWVGFAVALILAASIIGSIVDPMPAPVAARSPRPATTHVATTVQTATRSVVATTSRTSTAPPAALRTQAAAPGTRGLMNLVPWWNQHHQPTSLDECTSQGESPVGVERAWKLGNDAVACYDDQPFDTWGFRVINVDIYFPKRVNAQQAVAVASSILPGDSSRTETLSGVNNEVSKNSSGSCQQMVYTSAALGNVVRQANRSWTEDPTKATVTLYSGHTTSADGSDTAYNANNVNLAAVAIGPENRGADGSIDC